MKYEFGVMSSKWTLEANDQDVAFLTMVMHVKNPDIPIAVYNMNKTLNPMVIMDMDDLEGFIESHREKLKECRNTIKVVS